MDDVIFSLDTQPLGPPRDVTLPWADTNEILGRAVATGGIRVLRHHLELIRDGVADERVVIVREDMRLELLKILDAIAADARFSPALAELRKAARSRIIGG